MSALSAYRGRYAADAFVCSSPISRSVGAQNSRFDTILRGLSPSRKQSCMASRRNRCSFPQPDNFLGLGRVAAGVREFREGCVGFPPNIDACRFPARAATPSPGPEPDATGTLGKSDVHAGGRDARSSDSLASTNEVQVGGTGSGNGVGSSGSNFGGRGNSPGSGSSDDQEGLKKLMPPPEAVRESAQETGERLGGLFRALADILNKIFKVVPAQVITAVLGILSGVAAQRSKTKSERRAHMKSKEEAMRKHRENLERELRKKYVNFHAPLLSAAVRLSERLYLLVEGPYDLADLSRGEDPCPCATYSAYLLGCYLGLVELLKRESQTLDLGFPAADRIFTNILGRVQAVMCTDDDSLRRMQETERYFKPPPGVRPIAGGPFQVLPRSQAAIGELMLRGRWKEQELSSNSQHPSGVLTLVEFVRLLESDSDMQRWFNPLIADFGELERRCDESRGAVSSRKRKRIVKSIRSQVDRRTYIGARPYFLQCALQDLIDFLDPLPRVKFARPGLRRRLQLGCIHYGEEQRMPASLRGLYSELAHARDYNADVDNLANRIRRDKRIDIFVKSPVDTEVMLEEPTLHGDCPYSQRVLIALEELGCKYSMTSIPLRAKPSWFHLLHPEGSVPVMYHAGCLIADSRHIIGYILEQFPKANARLGSATSNLRIAVGTMTFTRFYTPFLAAMKGETRALGDMQRELRKLNGFVRDAQEKLDGPFLGGTEFSREDTAVVPMLHRVSIAGPELLGPEYGIPDDCFALKRYLEAAMERESFIKTVPSTQVVIDGYRSVRNEGAMMWLPDMLE